MRGAKLEQALKHPNWSMGPKITIDSATMFNKVLELVEAHHLFAIEPEKLAVLVHPQFAQNHFIYLSFTKLRPNSGTPAVTTMALARGRLCCCSASAAGQPSSADPERFLE